MPASPTSSSSASSRRTVVLVSLIILLVIGVRLSLLRQVTFCGVPDSCSYLSLAQTLDTQHIFQAQYADDLQLDHVKLPATGIEYWRPGTSFFLLLAKPFGHVTLRSSLVVTLFAGLLMSLAAWRIVMHFNQDRGLAALSVLLCFLFPSVWDSSLIPDSGLYYAAAVAWFLALFTVRFQGYAADITALLCVAIAYMVRNDAAILIVPLLVVLFLRARGRESASAYASGSSPAYCAAMVGGFFLALVPMHLLDLHVLGTAFPASTSRVLFFNDLTDLGRYGSLVNVHSWLSIGIGKLIKLRLTALPTIVYRIVFVLTGFGFIFVPLLFLRSRPDGNRPDRPEITGGLTFLATLVTVYGLILPAIGVFSALRTAFALFPLASVLILVAIRNFLPSRPAAILSTALIAFYLVSGVTLAKRIVTENGKDGAQMRIYGDFLHAQGIDPAAARILTDDPDQMYVTNGYPSIQLPSNGAEAVAKLAADLHATHILVNPAAHDLSLQELQDRLHPLATDPVPNSRIVLLRLPQSAPPATP